AAQRAAGGARRWGPDRRRRRAEPGVDRADDRTAGPRPAATGGDERGGGRVRAARRRRGAASVRVGGAVNELADRIPAGRLTAEELGRVHLIGIGGVGMSALARLLVTRGVPVSGSELREWPALAGLRALGATVHMTHEPSNLDGVDTVVYST